MTIIASLLTFTVNFVLPKWVRR